MLIRKIWKRKNPPQLFATIPNKNEDKIKEGDYVRIEKVKK